MCNNIITKRTTRGKRGHYIAECRLPTPAPRNDEKRYNCGRYGHYIVQCYLPTPAPQQYRPQRQQMQQRRPVANMACYGCGKLGHLIADCNVSRGQAAGASTSRGYYTKNKKQVYKRNNNNKHFKNHMNKYGTMNLISPTQSTNRMDRCRIGRYMQLHQPNKIWRYSTQHKFSGQDNRP